MTVFEAIDTATILSGHGDWINAEGLETLSQYPRESIETEFPHYVRSMDSPDDIDPPKADHPVFYGCYDWHSAVHSHWCLLRQLRLFDDHPEESDIVSSIEDRFITANVTQEVETFEDNQTFEKPYGWGWFLRLVAELSLWDDERANDWRAILQPLEAKIVSLTRERFLSQNRPFRVGTHQNSAFALQCILDYARVVSDDSLEAATVDTARRFFATDTDYPVEYEPLGWDFLSPSLTEADLMRRVLDRDDFTDWIAAFLPDVTTDDGFLDPIDMQSEPGEDLALHFVGLNLSKAWSLAGIADALDHHDTAVAFEASAERHAEQGLTMAFTDDYAGAHWLSSFVLYLLTRNDGGIAPR